jgi:hypothetical protein
MDLVFSLTAKQEIEFDAWLVEQNREIVQEQLENADGSIPDEQVEVLKKLLESGNPIPYHDGKVGYYSISFTPTDFGNRIYVHNHITNESFRLHDPSVEETSETQVVDGEVITGEFNPEDLATAEDE